MLNITWLKFFGFLVKIIANQLDFAEFMPIIL